MKHYSSLILLIPSMETSFYISRHNIFLLTFLVTNSGIFVIRWQISSSLVTLCIIGVWTHCFVIVWIMRRLSRCWLIITQGHVAVISLGWKQPNVFACRVLLSLNLQILCTSGQEVPPLLGLYQKYTHTLCSFTPYRFSQSLHQMGTWLCHLEPTFCEQPPLIIVVVSYFMKWVESMPIASNESIEQLFSCSITSSLGSLFLGNLSLTMVLISKARWCRIYLPDRASIMNTHHHTILRIMVK